MIKDDKLPEMEAIYYQNVFIFITGSLWRSRAERKSRVNEFYRAQHPRANQTLQMQVVY